MLKNYRELQLSKPFFFHDSNLAVLALLSLIRRSNSFGKTRAASDPRWSRQMRLFRSAPSHRVLSVLLPHLEPLRPLE